MKKRKKLTEEEIKKILKLKSQKDKKVSEHQIINK